MATAALVCGILGLIGGFIPVVKYFTLILSIVAIVLGVKTRKELGAQGQPTGMATAGMVLGIVGIGLTVLGIICIAALGLGGAAILAGL